MTMLNPKGLLMDKWHKTPNAVVDKLAGDVLSPNAIVCLIIIIRLTSGMNKPTAKIPNSTFQKKTGIKRRETMAKVIAELTDSGLVFASKSNGAVTEFSINNLCDLWYDVPKLEPVKQSDQYDETVPVLFNSTSTNKPYSPVLINRTGITKTSTFQPYTYKDNLKDNFKDKEKTFCFSKYALSKFNKKPSKRDLEIEEIFNTWLSLTGQSIKLNDKRKSQINARLKSGYTLDQITQAMQFVATSDWHKQSGNVTFELVMRSDEQLDKQLIKCSKPKPNDKLAVNQSWQPNNDGIIRQSTVSLEEMF